MIKIYKLKIEGKVYEVELEDISEKEGHILENKKTVIEEKKAEKTVNTNVDGEKVVSPMQGIILNVLVNVGDKVKSGQELVILEAMKMENPIVAPRDGEVISISVAKGDNVDDGHVLVTLA